MMRKPSHTVEQLRTGARSYLPRTVFDMVDGGAGQESALRRNQSAFESLRLMPRALIDRRTCDISTEILGQRFAAPFGIALMGLANLIRASST